ncbi:hypothetical protein CDD83_543 [Cordyceps sp. RAO-2017]|nr:hypothetical protein CDD83_543 [Cordyceps sp. RAO-2017]
MASWSGQSTPLQFTIGLTFIAPAAQPRLQSLSRVYRDAVYRGLDAEGCHFRLARQLQQAGLDAAFELTLREEDCEDDPYRTRALATTIRCNKTLRIIDPYTMPETAPAPAWLSSYADGLADILLPLRYWVVKPPPPYYVSPWSNPSRRLCWTELRTPNLFEAEVAAGLPRVEQALGIAQGAAHGGLDSLGGLYVDVSPISGLTLRQAQCAVTLVALLEVGLLFPLSTGCRRDRHGALLDCAKIFLYQRAPRAADEGFVRDMTDYLPADLLAAYDNREMLRLWGLPDLSDVSVMVEAETEGLRCALNVKGHPHPDGSIRHSLEFSYAEASFSKTHVAQWTVLILTIVKVACLPPARFRDVVACLCQIKPPYDRPRWEYLLRQLKNAAPGNMGYEIDEAYWVERRLLYEG